MKPKLDLLNYAYCRMAILIFAIVSFMPLVSCAQVITSEELINNAVLYDGKQVVYEGEVIGDVMYRQDYAWVNLLDGRNAIGIWLDKNLAATIVYTGNYKVRGDRLEINGVFHRACSEHGGDLDIHAQVIRKTNPGRPIKERLNTAKLNFVLVLLGVLCLALILRLLKSK
ncbi:DNA-binding protein [bacterium]|nr:MAG: DNA-binding protein [bacterium]